MDEHVVVLYPFKAEIKFIVILYNTVDKILEICLSCIR